ncbi:alpha/beta fold hydrolase [Paenibacillus sp. SYP-B4298]|uniref:alpha/beta fold hydrolase n=1 Tax=Paenibacillus sp. SYP-B4298 TaxID=2996034 RepID=UPI0022DE8A1D|nr:alpha/beta hydrolase [Paenibacillus sp. SYP-B4298]
MKLNSNYSKNNEVNIHYLDSINDSDSTLVPLLICPGLSEVAEEYEDFIKYMLPRRCVVLSFRGRGKSDTPNFGYDLKDHISDVESVVKDAKLDRFNLFAYSRGVSYALGYTRKYPEQIERLIIQDYPSEHKAMPNHWPQDYIDNYIVPFNRSGNIRALAVQGIQRESTQEAIRIKYTKPVLVMHGLQEGSLLSNEGLEQYKGQYSNIRIEGFSESGHDIRSKEKTKLYEIIKAFLD